MAKAEEECSLWQRKYDEYQSVCQKLQNEVEQKEIELHQMKELCCDLENHVQRLKPNTEKSIEEDTSFSWHPTSPGNYNSIFFFLRNKIEGFSIRSIDTSINKSAPYPPSSQTFTSPVTYFACLPATLYMPYLDLI